MKVYNTPRDKLNYMNTLNLKIELNKQSKNIDYQPFVPTIEQKSFFLDSNITDEELANMSADQFLRKKNEIDEAFEKNIRTIANPSMVNDIINKDPFKNKTFNKLFINKNWTLFIEKLKKKFVSVDNNTFNEFATEFIKKNAGKITDTIEEKQAATENKNLVLKRKETRAQREINSYNIEDMRVRNEAYDKNNLLKSVVYSNNKINEDYDRWDNITKWNGDNGDNLISLINSADEMNHIIVNDINNNQSIIDRSNKYMVDNEQKRDTIQNFSYIDAINEVKREIQNMIIIFNDIYDYMRNHNSQQYQEDRTKAENLLKIIKGSKLKYDDEIINNIKTIDERLETLDKNYGVRNTRNITRIMDKLANKYKASKFIKKFLLTTIIKNFNDRLNERKIYKVYNILKKDKKNDIVINEEAINNKLNELERSIELLYNDIDRSKMESFSAFENVKFIADDTLRYVNKADEKFYNIKQNFKNIENFYNKIKNKIATTEQINNIKDNLKDIKRNIETYKNEQKQNFNVYNQESKLQMNEIINEINGQIQNIINDVNKLKDLANNDKNNEYDQFKKEVLTSIQAFEENFNVQIKDKLNSLSNQDKLTYDDSSIKKLIDDIKNNLENQIIQSVNALQQENQNIKLTNEERYNLTNERINRAEENIRLTREEINELRNNLIQQVNELKDTLNRQSTKAEIKDVKEEINNMIKEFEQQYDIKLNAQFKEQLKDINQRMGQAEENIKLNRNEINELRNNLIKDVNELKDTLNRQSTKTEIKDVKEEINKMIKDFEQQYDIKLNAQFKEQLKDINTRMGQAEENIRLTRDEINNIKNELKQLIKDVNELKDNLNIYSPDKEIKRVENEIKQLIKDFEDRYNSKLPENLKEKLEDINKEIKNNDKDVKNMIDNIDKRVETNRADIKQLNTDMIYVKEQLIILMDEINILKDDLSDRPTKEEVRIYMDEVNKKIEEFEEKTGQEIPNDFKDKATNPSRRSSLSQKDGDETFQTMAGENEEGNEEKQRAEFKPEFKEANWNKLPSFDDLSKEDKLLFNKAMTRPGDFAKKFVPEMYTTGGGRNGKESKERHILMWIDDRETSNLFRHNIGPKDRLKKILDEDYNPVFDNEEKKQQHDKPRMVRDSNTRKLREETEEEKKHREEYDKYKEENEERLKKEQEQFKKEQEEKDNERRERRKKEKEDYDKRREENAKKEKDRLQKILDEEKEIKEGYKRKEEERRRKEEEEFNDPNKSKKQKQQEDDQRKKEIANNINNVLKNSKKSWNELYQMMYPNGKLKIGDKLPYDDYQKLVKAWLENNETGNKEQKGVIPEGTPNERLKQIIKKYDSNFYFKGYGIHSKKGGNIKPLNKQQKKKIILGEIKAGNNNPLLINFLRKK
jgi:hypothetical protein